MPSLLFASLDRLIEPSSPSFEETASSTDLSTNFSFYPLLYATPSHQRPPSPSSFSPSPYVLNFKRRGPMQQQWNVKKESSADAATDFSSQQQPSRMAAVRGEDMTAASVQLNQLAISDPIENGMLRRTGEVRLENEVFDIEPGKRHALKNVCARENQCFGNEDERFCSAFSSKMQSGTGCEHTRASSLNSSHAINEEVEFFDAPDSVISDSASEDEACSLIGKPGRWLEGSGGRTTSRLEEEIARRIKTEEAVALWQRRWNEMAKQYSSIWPSICSPTGVVLGNTENSSEILTQELMVARLVGGAIASAVVRAEKDEEIESILRVKNREISRLWDKLQYLELVNREMSQRNQEVIELTQRRRKRRQKRQKLALGGFCAAFCIGTAGLVFCKYIPWGNIKGWGTLFEKPSVGDHSSAEVYRK